MSEARPVRVGVNAAFLSPGAVSGTGIATWKVVEGLARRPDVELVVFAQSGWTPGDIADVADVVATPRLRSAPVRVAYEQTWLPRLVARRGVDVLWSPGYVGPLWGRFARVVTIHDVYYRHCPAAIPTIRRLYYRMFIPWSARRSDAVIVVSRTTRDDLVAEVPSVGPKCTVVHHGAGVDRSAGVPRPAEAGPPYVLMVAAVTRNKNPSVVVDAVSDLRRRGWDIEVRVVGADPYGVLREAIRHHDAGFVRQLGEVDDDELAGLYRDAVAYVHPSLYEGFGLPILEAQTMGVPVVASDAAAVPEVAGRGALYFAPTDAATLADHLETMLTSPAERDQLVEAGAANLTRFSWDRATEEIAAVLAGAAASVSPR